VEEPHRHKRKPHPKPVPKEYTKTSHIKFKRVIIQFAYHPASWNWALVPAFRWSVQHWIVLMSNTNFICNRCSHTVPFWPGVHDFGNFALQEGQKILFQFMVIFKMVHFLEHWVQMWASWLPCMTGEIHWSEYHKHACSTIQTQWSNHVCHCSILILLKYSMLVWQHWIEAHTMCEKQSVQFSQEVREHWSRACMACGRARGESLYQTKLEIKHIHPVNERQLVSIWWREYQNRCTIRRWARCKTWSALNT